MDGASIVLSLDADEGVRGFLHRWAGSDFWCAHALAHGATAAPRPPAPALEPDPDWEPVVEPEGTETPGAPLRILRATGGPVRWRIDYEDESYLVARDGSALARLTGSPGDAPPPLERLLGAPLALALALRGTYLLHASAVWRGGRAIALTAPSGGGKSTLAAAALAGDDRWRRLADDVLPVRLGASPFALPHFPQLKLGPADSYPLDAMPVVPLAALVELERGDGEGPLELERLGPAPAALALAGATVAARLFDGELLAAHLVACASASASLPVARLRYPSGLDRLPTVLDRLTALVP